MELFATDFVVIKEDKAPLRYNNGEIGLWSKDNLSEIKLINGEKFLPFKSELIKQIKNNH